MMRLRVLVLFALAPLGCGGEPPRVAEGADALPCHGSACRRSAAAQSVRSEWVRYLAIGCATGDTASCDALGPRSETKGEAAQPAGSGAPPLFMSEPGKTMRPGDAELEAACARQSARGCADLADSLADAPGPERLRAPDFMRKACDLGVISSCTDLGIAYSRGDLGLETNRERALQLLGDACEAGNVAACTQRGILQRPTLPVDAARFFSRGCERKSEASCDSLAGVISDARRACEGNARRCNNWGVLLAEGIGLPVDLAAGQKAYERGCSAGSPQACSNLGRLVRDAGKTTQAKTYLDKACKLGDDRACRDLGELPAKPASPAKPTTTLPF